MKMLQEFAKGERDKGNYVILGGDFNHNLCPEAPAFPSQQKCPGWVGDFDAKDFAGYSVIADSSYPTCRSTDIPYEEGVNYIVTIDGFLVSDNIEVTEVKNIHSDFIYSDHNPATMKFILH
jgi:exonuclease III